MINFDPFPLINSFPKQSSIKMHHWLMHNQNFFVAKKIDWSCNHIKSINNNSS
jgi:hypothetical protein